MGNEGKQPKTGRKTKYKTELIKEICADLAIGMSRRDSCVGKIDEATFFRWMNGDLPQCILEGLTGDALERKRKEFCEAVEGAEKDFKRKMIGSVYAGALKKSPTHAQWILERKYPAEFKERKEVEHTGEVKNTHEFSDEQLDSFIAILGETKGAGNPEGESGGGEEAAAS